MSVSLFFAIDMSRIRVHVPAVSVSMLHNLYISVFMNITYDLYYEMDVFHKTFAVTMYFLNYVVGL